MTNVLLCAGPTLLVIDKDGSLFYRRPGQSDVAIPYSRSNYPAFFHSARYKFDLSRVIGPGGETNPTITEGGDFPELRHERLATGETVYHLEPREPSPAEPPGSVQAAPPAEILIRR